MLVWNAIVKTLMSLGRATSRSEPAPVHYFAMTSLEDDLRFPDGKRSPIDASGDFREILVAFLRKVKKGGDKRVFYVFFTGCRVASANLILYMSDNVAWNGDFQGGWKEVLGAFNMSMIVFDY
jgi:hypothetical protein